ncbi:hypothetical protein [Pseudomonas pohangensis]|nr:hypothetical protein [Pseudomonas pohangensis]
MALLKVFKALLGKKGTDLLGHCPFMADSVEKVRRDFPDRKVRA